MRDPEAYDLYLRGRYYWNNNHTPQDFDRASAFFQKSIEKDPDYAPVYAGLADCYASLAIAADMAPSKSFPHAEDAAKNAVELDDSLPGEGVCEGQSGLRAHLLRSRIKLHKGLASPEGI